MYALTQSTLAFAKDTTAHFPLSKGSSHFVFKISDVHVFINVGTSGYLTTLPLINRGSFTVYHMIPVPMALKNSKFSYIT